MNNGFGLTVLGSSGSHTGPGRVCSGYLVRAGGTSLLVDAGNGSTANLQRELRFDEIDAVLVSHRHLDHCADLIGMFYALRFGHPGVRIPLYAPQDTLDTLLGMLSADSALAFDEVFDFRPVTGGDSVQVGVIEVEFFDALHPPPSVSMWFSFESRVLAYSGDSAGGDELVACARNADLLLCEATWQGDASDYPDGIHLVARDAGAVATRAGARRLVLTHVAGGLDRSVSRAQAEEAFDGSVEAAADLMHFDVGDA